MRGTFMWLLAGLGVVAVILAAVAIGSSDRTDETVPAGEWAQDVCGAVGVWRGELEAIVEDVRTPPAFGDQGGEEPQSETPQGRTTLIRGGLERSVQAAETLVLGIYHAGTPDTESGEEAAEAVSDWANTVLADLEDAEEALDEEAETLEGSIEQLLDALGIVGATLATGAETIADIARDDPELAAALRDSSTCRQLREETSR